MTNPASAYVPDRESMVCVTRGLYPTTMLHSIIRDMVLAPARGQDWLRAILSRHGARRIADLDHEASVEIVVDVNYAYALQDAAAALEKPTAA
jgi:hypothetical protein